MDGVERKFEYKYTSVLTKYKNDPMSNTDNMETQISDKNENKKKSDPNERKNYWRALIAYWLLGLCNNYGYVVMLTAAGDIIKEEVETSKERHCTYMSTGTILLADIIPALVVKLCGPFIPFFLNIRVGTNVILSAVGFIIVAFSQSITMSIIGVVITSFCSGLGELTFLQYSSYFDKSVVSTWSSGTGAAGVIGATSYTLLQVLGLKTTLLILIIVPAIMALSFWVILPKPDAPIQTLVNKEELDKPKEAFNKKLKQIPGLMKFMIPLASVYLLEYFINQGTFELIYKKNDFVEPGAQYRWLQVDYQIGVFISRSSVNLFHIKQIWLMTVFQLINVIIFTTEVIFSYIPYFWIILILTLWEGLLGGAAYVNTYYRISREIPEEKKQFSLAITTFGDTIGITLAGIFAIYSHNAICSLPPPEKL